MKSIFFSFFLLLLVLPACAEQTDTRTNLLVIMTDQQRFDALSATGNSVLETRLCLSARRPGPVFLPDNP